MPFGKTCLRMRSEIQNVLRRASTFLVLLQALSATIAQAAPAASQSSDSTPRARSVCLRADDAGSRFIVGGLPRRGHYTERSARPQYKREPPRSLRGRGALRLNARVLAGQC